MSAVSVKHRVKLDYNAYRQLPDDGKRHELIHGELYMSPSPNRKHQGVLRNLFRILDQFIREDKIKGALYFSPLDVVFSTHSVVQPDMVFISSDRKEILTDANIQGAPDLIVEVLSDSTSERDWGIKKDLYHQNGVEEYWVIDPVAESITVFSLNETYTRPAVFWKGDVVKTLIFNKLKIEVEFIFKDW